MDKIRNIFSFLKDYNGLLNPIITELDKQIRHYRFSDMPQIEELWSIYNVQDLGDSRILEIKRPNMSPCPFPDKMIKEWIQEEWQKLDIASISHKGKITNESVEENGEIIQTEEYFADDEGRTKKFEEWLQKREDWRIREVPKREGLDLYNNLFELYSYIKRESESVELILGDGHIKWSTEGRCIDHPVLLQKVNLEFNPDRPSFIIKCDELKTELYTPMLRAISSINQSMIPDIIQEAENIYHIADKENNIGFFKRLINVIDPNGKYVGDLNKIHNGPVIAHNPAIFLRKRTLGYSIFIDSIIEDIDKNENKDFPQFFQNMVGNYREKRNNDVVEDNWNYNGIDQDILLTLPANNEQLKIIKYLHSYGAVLVQGPPGTGKTHTIANLIGHLLSEGKSVLVASQTEKALTVLKDKVYGDLQNLCISLLSTSSQQKEMDSTLFEIDEKTTIIDPNDLPEKIYKLGAERQKLIETYKEKYQELIRVRSLDYKDIVFANETIRPIEAAKFIDSGKGKYDYIPGESRDDTVPILLSHEELHELYKSNEMIIDIEEELLDSNLPGSDDIWAADIFETKVTESLKYKALIKGWEPKIKINESVNKWLLQELIKDGENIRNSLRELEDFQLDIMARNIADKVHIELWDGIFKSYHTLKLNYEEYKKMKFKNDYYIPEELMSTDVLSLLNEIISTNKKVPVGVLIGIVKPKWKRMQKSITNNDKSIEKMEEYKDVKFIIDYELNRNKLLKQIKKLLGKFSNGMDFGARNSEIKLKAFMQQAQTALNWHKDKWIYYTTKIKNYIVDLDTANKLLSIDMSRPTESMDFILENIFIKELKYNYYSVLFKELEGELNAYENYLKKFNVSREPFDRFIGSIKQKNVEEYRVYYEKIIYLYNKKNMYSNRIRLLEKLETVAPGWAEAIKRREGIHGNSVVPKDIESAWRWSQLNSQISQINSYDPNVIQREIDEINKALMINARELAYEKAWYCKIKNTTDEQIQAIKGWRQTIKQVGKGTGKNAPRLLKKARELMPRCQTAIPVWIMPLNRVAENFDPQSNRFDVVIIDEASQADLLALSALYLGEKIIIVGDDEQVSPNPVGIKIHEINALIEQHLQDIPLNHLYNVQTSIYDMAQNSGFKPLMLTEHFRCLPEIIEFSNGLSYNNKIRPLRDASQVNVKPAVIPYRVPEGFKTPDKTNKMEAEHIVSLICACIENEEYRGKTMGVISLVGQKQAYEIDKLLQSKLEPRDYESRKIQCGNPAQFQGDERDIIFLSIVDGPNEDGTPIRLISESGRNDMDRKRYNVAASRARDQMWVIYSLNPEIDLKPGDIRLRLIKHVLNPSVVNHEKQLNKAESDFERKVIKSLQNRGYDVNPQWEVGLYRIDIVVKDGDKRMAIECDGERWHTLDNLAEDMKRQAILERLGWRFIRIRGSQFYKSPEGTMEWVFKELDNYDIKPIHRDIGGDIDEDRIQENELFKNIKRRANEIRIEWNEDKKEVGTNHENKEIIVGEIDIQKIAVETENNNAEAKGEIVREVVETEIVRDENIDINKSSDAPMFDFTKNKISKEAGNNTNGNLNLNAEKEGRDFITIKPLFDFRGRIAD